MTAAVCSSRRAKRETASLLGGFGSFMFWPAVQDATGYEVGYNDAPIWPDYPASQIVDVGNVTSVSASTLGLGVGTWYLAVRAYYVTRSNYDAWSAEVTKSI